MRPDTNNLNTQSGNSRNEAPVRTFSIFSWIQGVSGSIFRTTVRLVKNIPSRMHNKYLRYRNEKKRMPRRKTKSKVYVLVGYTTKEHVDRRFAALKVQQLIRKTLIALIVIVFLVIMYNWLDPLGNTNEIKQIVGIEKINDLAQEDPFQADVTTNQVQVNKVTVTVTVTPAP